MQREGKINLTKIRFATNFYYSFENIINYHYKNLNSSFEFNIIDL